MSFYRILVNNTVTGKTAWDSGKVVGAIPNQIACATALDADTAYSWAVQWWDAEGAASPWSSPASFATGTLGDGPWTSASSQWIGCGGPSTNTSDGANQLRYEFTLAPSKAQVVQARLYVSGLGWHMGFLNGERLSTATGGIPILEPAFTSLRLRVLYSSHDVTALLNPSGPNVFGAFLGHGWPEIIVPWQPDGSGTPPWNGTGSGSAAGAYERIPAALAALISADREALISLTEEEVQQLRSGHTGYQRRLRFLLSVRYSDGTTQTVTSFAQNMGASEEGSTAATPAAVAPAGRGATGTWMCGAGSLLYDNLYDGATIDARLETTGWLSPGYNYSTPSASAWSPAVRIAEPGGAMSATDFPQVEAITTFDPISMWESTPGSYVFDLGQNIAGAVELTIPAPHDAGLEVIVRHAESVLHPPYGPQNGSLYYGNLRSAKATDTYYTAGAQTGSEVFWPLFTWHGFRYVEVSGLPFVPPLVGVVKGVHFRSAVASAGDLAFPSGAFVMNQLQHAITWGQGNNLMGNPSDCPQRDERLGWTGDAALTAEEASFNYDMAAFYTHWANSLRDNSQNTVDPTYTRPGEISAVVPDVIGGYDQDLSWATVYPTTVYTLFKSYGDTSVVKDHWSNVLAYVNASAAAIAANKYSTWGDWCPPPAQLGGGQGPKPPASFTAMTSFIEDLQHVAEMAGAIGDDGSKTYVTNMRDTLIAEYNAQWYNASGKYYVSPTQGVQTADSCALMLPGVVPSADVPAVVAGLVNDIATVHAGHTSTGIIGTKYQTRALTANGHSWLAINVTLQTDYPSFGWAFNHPIEPATTLWELWDGPAEGPGMNSRDHIMQGAIGAWLYTDVAGIAQSEGTYGWTNALIWPRTTDHSALPYASGWHDTIMGRITVQWANVTATSFTLSVSIPVGSVAEVRIPYLEGTPAASLVATEGSTPAPFFTGGAFVPSAVKGVQSAAPYTGGPRPALSVFIGSGDYSFALNW